MRANGLRDLVILVALLMPVTGYPASSSNALSQKQARSDQQPSEKPLDELDQVEVVGVTRTSRTDIAAWFRRVAGNYRGTGSVSYAAGSKIEVWGKTTCSLFGTGPGLQCTLNLKSADGVTNLDPGILLFGFDLDRPRIRFMAVEDSGNAEGTVGDLQGDTAIFRAECVTRVRPCYRTTAITARPRSDQVKMEVFIEAAGSPIAQYAIVLTRLAETSATAPGAGAETPPPTRNDKRPR